MSTNITNVTKVQIIDVLRALYRWDANDVKLLFMEEMQGISELLRAKESQLLLLETNVNSIRNKSIETNETITEKQSSDESESKKVVNLQNEVQFIRQTNQILYDEGLQLINGLKLRISQLETQLAQNNIQSNDELRDVRNRNSELDKNNSLLRAENKVLNNNLISIQSKLCSQNNLISNNQIECQKLKNLLKI